ncbi:hypothetical protein LUZ60_009619 [Juncus effusus]|nr:hypothetical protein LUZ60_009619 [Juncus effusus]
MLAGVVAVEVTGRSTVDFVPGRKNSSVCPREGCLPDVKQGVSHLRVIFYRMVLSDKDIVALSDAHTLLIQKDLDFTEVLKGEAEWLLKLPTDRALLDDPNFRHYVELYAKVKTTNTKNYSVRPNTGVVQPGVSCNLTLCLG